MAKYVSRFVLAVVIFLQVLLVFAQENAVTEIRFNDGEAGASITFDANTTATATIASGVISINAQNVLFRVKCRPVAEAPSSECVVYAGGAGQLPDSDGDGVADGLDDCADTPTGEAVDSVGCSNSQKDSDNDGVSDAIDECPGTTAGESVNSVGCVPAPVTNPEGYCVNTPANFLCAPEVTFDPLNQNAALDLSLPAGKGYSVPFTVTAGGTASGEFVFFENDSIAQGYNLTAWFSYTPGGAPLTNGSRCLVAKNDINGSTVDWAQSGIAASNNCILGQDPVTIYYNFAVLDGNSNTTYTSNFFLTVLKYAQ